MDPFRTISAGEGRTRVRATLFRMGPDILAVLDGAGAHIGAASLAEAGRDDGVDVSTVRARGHRETELTERFSRAVSASTGCRVVTVAGIHLDRITKEEIEAIRGNVGELIRCLARSSAEDSG